MTTTSLKKLILVDGSSYLFRAFHALPPLSNRDGKPTNALLGVLNMLKRLCEEHECSHIAVVFDAKGKNFRHELYPAYKANRLAMPDELRVQIEPLHELIELQGFPLIKVEGVEADDVIGSLTYKALRSGYEVLISTGDKDMVQLLQPGVQIVDTMKNVLLDEAYILQKLGIRPTQMIDFLALTGDSSDNIPGIPKVGPKTAAKWLHNYQNLDNLKANAHEITGKVGEYLRESLGQLELSKKLATILIDLDLPFEVDTFVKKTGCPQKLRETYHYWGLNSWLKTLDSPENLFANRQSSKHYTCIQDASTWEKWYQALLKAPLICVDTETDNLEALKARLIGLSFAFEKDGEIQAAYLPLRHDGPDKPTQLPYEPTLQQVKAILENPNSQKIGQNLKYDLKVFACHGISVQNIYFDTMLASYVLDSGLTEHNLYKLAQRHLNLETIQYEDIAGKGVKQLPFNRIPLEKAFPYAAEDAEVTFKIYQVLHAKLKENLELGKIFFEHEMPLLPVLVRMEQNGVMIDVELLLKQSQVISDELALLEQKAFQLVGREFNLASPKQLQAILYEEMGLPIVKKTPKGQPSTSEEVLHKLAEEFELAQIILKHRHLSKLKSTYTEKLPKQVNVHTNRVHTQYHQAVAVTGRLSSSDPNLQNIPVRTPQGREIRKAFIAPLDKVIMSADYSQIELRIMAHLSQDTQLCQAFQKGLDIHAATAAEVAGCPLEAVTPEQRYRAKAVNFGLIYGMSAFGLAKQLNITREEAETYVKIYFERYPGIKRYMENTREFAKTHGFVETLFGRRLYLPDIHSKNGMKVKAAERAAINAPMQGTASDIIKRAMITIDHSLTHQQFDDDKNRIKMIMQVHDELVFEVPENQIEAFQPLLHEKMVHAGILSVPLEVNIGIGKNWEMAH